MRKVVLAAILLATSPATAEVWDCTYQNFIPSHARYRVTHNEIHVEIASGIVYRIIENSDVGLVGIWAGSFEKTSHIGPVIDTKIIVINKTNGALLLGYGYLGDEPSEPIWYRGVCHKL